MATRSSARGELCEAFGVEQHDDLALAFDRAARHLLDDGLRVLASVTADQATRAAPEALGELGVATQDSEMSMSVRCDGCGLEYAGSKGVAGLFVQMAYYGPRRPAGSNLRLMTPDLKKTTEGVRQTVLAKALARHRLRPTWELLAPTGAIDICRA